MTSPHEEDKTRAPEETSMRLRKAGDFFGAIDALRPEGDPIAILQDLGVEAVLTERSEEPCMEGRFGSHRYRWMIEVRDGPIRQVAIDHFYGRSMGYEGPDEESSLMIEFLVPDSRIGPGFPPVRICSVKVRGFPAFWKVMRVRWEDWYMSCLRRNHMDGDHVRREASTPLFGSGAASEELIADVIRRLGQDKAITAAVVESGSDLTIDAYGARGCWVLRKEKRHEFLGNRKLDPDEAQKLLGPTSLQWDCYRAIAEILLTTPVLTDRSS